MTTTQSRRADAPRIRVSTARAAGLAAARLLAAVLRSGAAAVRPAETVVRMVVRAVSGVASTAARAGWRVASPVVRVVTPAGWTVATVAVVAIALSLGFAWQEFTYLGFVLAAAFVISGFFLIGRSSYGVVIELNPRRVVVGDRALGRMAVTNTGTRALAPVRMELPVGKGVAEFQLAAMKPGDGIEELFAVPTNRRAVIVAGPAESVRGDQLGLMRRAVRWTEPVDLFVHPLTVRLAATASGLVRDLEGQVSKKITNSDIAFHALRPYVPGDDRRYVHWRTSARIGQLMVRQFEETRRSQLTVIHNAEQSLYASDDEFELAMSVTASIAAQVIIDGTQMNVVSEGGVWKTPTVTSMLDHSCRIEPVDRRYPNPRAFVRDRTRRLPAPSIVMTVAGSAMTTADFRSIEALFGQDTSQVAFRVELGAAPGVARVGTLTMLTIGRLTDLRGLMRLVTS